MNHVIFIVLACILWTPVSAQDAIIQSRQTSVEVRDNKLVTDESTKILIQKREGDQYARVDIYYQRGDKLDIEYAEVLDASGNVVKKIKKKDLVTRSAISDISFYDEGMVMELDMRWHQYPYQIRYAYTHIESKYLNIDWMPFLFSRVPVRDAKLEVTLPADVKVSLHFDSALTHQASNIDGKSIHTWRVENIEPVIPEDYSPSFRELNAHVLVAPESFHYGIEGKQDSWSHFGQWYASLNAGRQELTTDEKNKIKKLIAGKVGLLDKVKALYSYMQENTRYVYVSTDIGGLQTHPATYVCQNKFGDCKALTNYMQAILSEVGIKSHMVLVHAGENSIFLHQDIPTSQFNHVILCIPNSGDTIWLENTVDRIPAGYLGTFTQDRLALLVDGEASRLVRTPKLRAEDVWCENHFKFVIDQSRNVGSLEARLDSRGHWYEYDQQVRDQLHERQLPGFFARRCNLSNVTIDKHRFSDFEDEARVSLELEGEVQSPLRKVADMYVISAPTINMKKFDKPHRRNTPLEITYPIFQIDTFLYKVESAEKFVFTSFERMAIDSEFGQYSVQSQVQGNTASIIRKYVLKDNTVDRSEYDDFFAFIDQINKIQSRAKVILTKQKT